MQVSFRDLDAALRRAGAASDAAEAHGTLAGWLASGQGDATEPWLEPVLDGCDPRESAVGACRALLLELHTATRAALGSEVFSFEPLLPDDEQALEARVEALAEWCQGFLYGLSLGGVAAQQGSEEVREVIADFAQLGRAGLTADGDAEEDESAYADLVEYVRVGAQLVHDELALRAHAAPPGLH
jgi:uncharacterized protein YgfB (UPF0149 family)